MLKLNPSLLDKRSKEVIQMLWFSLLFTEVNSSRFRESRKTELGYGIKSNQSTTTISDYSLLSTSASESSLVGESTNFDSARESTCSDPNYQVERP